MVVVCGCGLWFCDFVVYRLIIIPTLVSTSTLTRVSQNLKFQLWSRLNEKILRRTVVCGVVDSD